MTAAPRPSRMSGTKSCRGSAAGRPESPKRSEQVRQTSHGDTQSRRLRFAVSRWLDSELVSASSAPSALELFFETADPTEVTRRLHGEVFVTRVEVLVG